jgi:hypothetical protein
MHLFRCMLFVTATNVLLTDHPHRGLRGEPPTMTGRTVDRVLAAFRSGVST